MDGNGLLNPEEDNKNTQILQALKVVHDPRSSNTIRQDASRYLEQLRSDEEAPYHGFRLAFAKEHSAIVRHYGLSLLEYAIRHRWSDYSTEQSQAVRDWILSLAYGTVEMDPAYITNKIAEIWVELAKRSWAIDWMDMDELLAKLWDGQVAQKALVLTILENLSDEIFSNEDALVAMRGSELNRACVEIFTPAIVLSEHFPTREITVNVRFEADGWLSRMADILESYVSDGKVHQDWQSVAVKTLSTFRSVVSWVIPQALVATRSVRRLCSCLAVSGMPVQLAAMEALYALYNRTRFAEDEFRDLVGPMFESETMTLLKQLYEWLIVDAADIDDAKYLMLKKFSEMIYNIGRLLSERPSQLPERSDLGGFLELLLNITKNESLQVSIPALHLWVKFLTLDSISKSPAVMALIGDLLETCRLRLIRYEALSEDSNNPSIIFLNEDIETMPERHAFLGNYSRFCSQIVELVAQQQPIDALYHILGQADEVLEHVYDGEPAFQAATYTKNSVPLLKIDAQFSVLEAALKGCLKWIMSSEDRAMEHEAEIMISNLRVWCDRLLGFTFEDPLIKERVIQLAVGFTIGPLKRDPQFAVRVFDNILDTRCPDHLDCIAYTDAVKDLQAFSVHQLQRLAMRFADHLVTIFDEVERKVMAVCQAVASDQQTQARYSSVLFVIMHRATSVDPAPRAARLEKFLQPLIEQWQDQRLSHSLASFGSFTELLGLENIQHYLSSRDPQRIEDWSSHPLDDEGKAIQVQMQSAIDTLPLRATKHIMSVSVEKLEPGSKTYDMACQLWHKYLPLILPNLLQFIGQSQALHDPENWPDLPPEMKEVVRRIFRDRFWQVGISQGSRDDFYAKIGGTRTTMEGFASSIRATVRTVRETGYRILNYMSLLGEHFYSFQDLPGPLSRALFADACALSPHQMATLVDMMRPMIDKCPESSRSHFFPPILAALFNQVDRKASSEWERIEEKNAAAAADDDLATEMKDESILRQLTMASVMLVVGLLDPKVSTLIAPVALVHQANENTNQHLPETTRSFILRTPEILKPVLLFCTHALRMRDTRACSLIAKVLRALVPEFSSDSPVETDVREFISTEVLKACVTSLNEPYFVDMQKDFAQLVAGIFVTYTPRTETPKIIVLSLPGMSTEKVDRAVRHLFRAQTNPRQQRAIILDLLKGFRGIAINEQGKIPLPDPRKKRSAIEQKYLNADMDTNEKKETSPDLGGISEMFA